MASPSAWRTINGVPIKLSDLLHFARGDGCARANGRALVREELGVRFAQQTAVRVQRLSLWPDLRPSFLRRGTCHHVQASRALSGRTPRGSPPRASGRGGARCQRPAHQGQTPPRPSISCALSAEADHTFNFKAVDTASRRLLPRFPWSRRPPRPLPRRAPCTTG